MIQWSTPAGFLFTATEGLFVIENVIATGTNITYKLLNGKLPRGLEITTAGTIIGTPASVLTIQTSTFVVRVENSSTAIDRTFRIDVQGPNTPLWTTYTLVKGASTGTFTTSTSEGYLALGIDQSPYVLNRQYVDYQLSANPIGAPENTKINFYIDPADGKLPPDLKLDKNGKITGFLNYFSETSLSTGTSTIPSIYLPKVYELDITASDGVAEEKRNVKILALDPNYFQPGFPRPTTNIDILDSEFVSPNLTYLQPVQFIYGNDLGTVRAENNATIPIKTYDPTPNIGTLTYTLITGTSVLTKLPKNLSLDPKTGYIYGFIPYQPAYIKNYTLTVQATKHDTTTGQSITATNTMTLAVKGMVESSIEWISTSSLGSITTGEISELAVKAQQLTANYDIKYNQTSGTLPPGLTLLSDGTISGKVNYGTTGTYTFGVEALDVYESSSIEKEFTINVLDDAKTYTEIYMRPFLTLEKRQLYSKFINDEFIFPKEFIYRYSDINFGVQRDLKIVLEFGLERVDVEKYIQALQTNFYRKNFYFGPLKTSIARDQNGIILYEIIYADVIDNMINLENVSIASSISINNITYYPSSIDNMRTKLENIELDDSLPISVNKNHLPKFMKTYQENNYTQPGYMKIIPICYALPNYSQQILSRIKLSGFDFNLLNFDVDRIIVKNSFENNKEEYLIFPRKNINLT